MKDKFRHFLEGRQGMDELSKALFWYGLAALLISGLCINLLRGIPSTLLSWFGLFAVILSFVRAFSRRLAQRELENSAFLAMRARNRRSFEAWKDRFRQRRNYRFFKCPGCGTILRVPRGKGKIHISCKCGYILYRKT